MYPFWTDLAEALERAGIATPEQRDRLLAEFQRLEREDWDRQMEGVAKDLEWRASRPWWKRVLSP